MTKNPSPKLTMDVTATGPMIKVSKAPAREQLVKTDKVVTEAIEAPKLPAVYREGTHSAIVFEMSDKEVVLVTMANLTLDRMRRARFDEEFEEYANYPVRRAAEVFLGAGQYREIPTQARELLEGIVGDKSTVYKQFSNQPKEDEMTQHPLRRSTDKPAAAPKAAKAEVPAEKKTDVATKPAGKKAPVVKAEAPAKAAPAGKKAPVAEPAAKPTAKAEKPAKAAPWDAKGAKKADAEEPKKASGGRSKISDDTKYKIGDTSSVKRGFILEFVEKAGTFGKKPFTRLELEALYGGRQEDPKMGTYFPYCVDKGVFVEA